MVKEGKSSEKQEEGDQSDSPILDSASILPPGDHDETLVEDSDCERDYVTIIDDWSQTGRGSHVDFEDNENVPLEQGAQISSPWNHTY
jgi:hypothetical protein